MLKGCERRIIYIKDTGSTLFKEAYFVLREGAPRKDRFDMVNEAMRIIRERSDILTVADGESKKPKKPGRIIGEIAVGAGIFVLGGLLSYVIL